MLTTMMVREGHKVKPSALASGSQSIICLICEAGELRSGGPNEVRCPVCGYAPSRGVLQALRQIITLPDALGSHACECGHPEMRRLPDGMFHCPACSSEVLPKRSECRAPNAARKPSAPREIVTNPVAGAPTHGKHRRSSARGA